MPDDELAPERAPLLGPQPSTVDDSNEVADDNAILVKDEARQTISVARGTFCVIALGGLIFLQGMQYHIILHILYLNEHTLT